MTSVRVVCSGSSRGGAQRHGPPPRTITFLVELPRNDPINQSRRTPPHVWSGATEIVRCFLLFSFIAEPRCKTPRQTHAVKKTRPQQHKEHKVTWQCAGLSRLKNYRPLSFSDPLTLSFVYHLNLLFHERCCSSRFLF